MYKYLCAFLLVTLCLSSSVMAEEVYSLVNITKVGHRKLETIKKSVQWWVELDQQLFVRAKKEALKEYKHKILDLEVNDKNLYFFQKHQHETHESIPGKILALGGRIFLVYAAKRDKDLTPLKKNYVLARSRYNSPQPFKRTSFPPETKDVADQIDGSRWFADVETLASYNRYTHGKEIIKARDWFVKEFEKLPGIEVRLVPFRVGSTETYNVVAVLKGTERPNDWYVVGGHYDSISENPKSKAPGAEDNASGAAGVLELARAFSKHPPKATMVFIAFSGEEQGLYGSKKHVSDLFSSGNKDKFKSAHTMDMIGFTKDADYDCLIETKRSESDLVELYTDAATQFTSLRIVVSYNPFGSDHMPYLNKRLSALLIIENDWDDYRHYHKTTDTAEKIDVKFAAQVLRMTAAALAKLVY